ncbi:protoporphyrinogen oxidase [Microbacterium barkeri]|uniref:Protoporphyrinogen oxidase n=1 Tax=Microbacterium barkeri TaxID=33917 RepID=A0A9W6H3B9_9MICO|nr:FAD-dependent oxidoreductase [Microbacterium barkeri]MDR6877312.1 oxygen-dependent protoporphyrinogen oxidase [Microbacterium barkeri]GLJ61219.1 protoporphyrinogen oxidase [Microbacterium barkeri]
MTEQLDELYAHAHEKHVVVVGGGVAGLIAAWECAKVGMRVTVLEAGERPGGVLRSAEVGGVVLDLGAESFATRGGHVRALIDELGLSDDVVAPGTGAGGAWVAGVPGVGAAPLPKGGVLGIPANPFAEDVRRILGWGGAWRAYLDRLKPVLTIGHEHSLGRLVRSRLGEKALDRLVAPVTTGVYSAHPDDIDPDVAAPGLNAALTRTGSLTGAVADLAGARTSAPGGAVLGLRGGMARLADALVERLEVLGAEVRTRAAVDGLERAGATWTIRLAAREERDEDDAVSGPAVDVGPLEADVVVVAIGEAGARRLLAPHVTGLAAEPARPGPVVEIVTLVLDAPELDAKPRGTGVLTVPGSHRAKALTHATAKWQWVAEAAGAHRHVVRVSFGTQNEEPATAGLDDDEAAALALEEASALLGVALAPHQLAGARRERFLQAQPAATVGLKAATAQARAAIQTAPGIGAVGAWLAGTGLAQVVPDAIAEAERVRRRALFS